MWQVLIVVYTNSYHNICHEVVCDLSWARQTNSAREGCQGIRSEVVVPESWSLA